MSATCMRGTLLPAMFSSMFFIARLYRESRLKSVLPIFRSSSVSILLLDMESRR
eukprot:CAMPEP_0182551738 /NCGR_PEP_ID=MMETSP1323-20130603/46033_1 /TAXON_ID=236787 /ORGANISM="Florenciella parvula, Strain RCC1693" /LENGTH=53 /DNA_ID=CAMNT_0024763369 /DNA_START=14 /DNA_END=171 /DNA_ORIENTATION=-